MRRQRKNIPIFVGLGAIVLIVLVLAIGSMGGENGASSSIYPTDTLEPPIASSPIVFTTVEIPTVEIPPSMLATPIPPVVELPIVEDVDSGLKYVDGDVIVKFIPGVTVDMAAGLTNSDAINNILNAHQVESFDSLASLPEGLSLENVPIINQYYKITFQKGTNVLSVSDVLSTLPDVDFALVNAIVEIDRTDSDISIQEKILVQPTPPPSPTATPISPNDPCFDGGCGICQGVSGQWVLNDSSNANLGVQAAWSITTGSENVVVAVIDSGYDILHPELRTKYAGHAYDFINDRINVIDENGHGTSVSGIIAAVTNNNEGIAGMAWGARIMPLKVLNANGRGSEWDIGEAILWAGYNGADVINMSLGGTYGFLYFGRDHVVDMYQDFVNHVHEAFDVVVVVAAGNDHELLDNSDSTNHLPAELENVIVVGATNENDENCRPNRGLINLQDTNCGWPSRKGSGNGPLLDVMAPGSANICTTQPTFDFVRNVQQDHYRSDFGGTSAATPYVSGLVALMLSIDPDLTPDEIESIIKQTAHHLGPTGDHDCGTNTGGNDDFGCGRIDVHAAIDAVKPSQPPPQIGTGNTATLLVVDVSGSMSDSWHEGIKIDSAKSAANQIVYMLAQETQGSGIQHRVGLATFTTNAKLELGLTSSYDQTRAVISGLHPRNNTNLGAGLSVANDALVQAGPNESKIIILLSDGLTNAGLSQGGILNGPVQDAVNAGTCIYTIGFGDKGALDEVFLEQIATTSGCGEYFYAEYGTELESTYIKVRHISTGTLLAEFDGSVAQDETVEAGTFDVPDGKAELAVTLHWPGSALDLQLEDPRGKVVDENYQGASIETYPNLVYALIQNPKPGTWKTDVHGREVPGGITQFDAIASVRGTAVVPTGGPGAGIVIVIMALVAGGVVAYNLKIGREKEKKITRAVAAGATLEFTAGPLAGQTKTIPHGSVVIGRGSNCDLRLIDRSVSRRHATIRHADGAWFIQDLGSRGGTLVNGHRVDATRLKPGDQIQIGNSSMIFKMN